MKSITKQVCFVLWVILLICIPVHRLESTQYNPIVMKGLIPLNDTSLCSMIQESEFAYLESEFCAIDEVW